MKALDWLLNAEIQLDPERAKAFSAQVQNAAVRYLAAISIGMTDSIVVIKKNNKGRRVTATPDQKAWACAHGQNVLNQVAGAWVKQDLKIPGGAERFNAMNGDEIRDLAYHAVGQRLTDLLRTAAKNKEYLFDHTITNMNGDPTTRYERRLVEHAFRTAAGNAAPIVEKMMLPLASQTSGSVPVRPTPAVA